MSRRKYFLSPEEIQVIQRYYDGTTDRIDQIVRTLGEKYPRWHIRKIAAGMGLARCKEPHWTEREMEYLHENYPKHGYVALRNGLRRINGGVTRSRTAIVLKAKRIRINKRSDGFTMRMVEDMLGADHHKIEKWVERGWLRDGRKGTERTAAQGGDMRHFEAKDLREFVIRHWEEIDLRRVERFNFIYLVAGLL